MRGPTAYSLSIMAIALALNLPGVIGVERPEAPQRPDPDIAWAEAIGPETLARVTDAVSHYLADPDDLSIPSCWEDEALVVIVDYVTPEGPYVVPELVGYLGCVPVDNLPVTGNRP